MSIKPGGDLGCRNSVSFATTATRCLSCFTISSPLSARTRQHSRASFQPTRISTPPIAHYYPLSDPQYEQLLSKLNAALSSQLRWRTLWIFTRSHDLFNEILYDRDGFEDKSWRIGDLESQRRALWLHCATQGPLRLSSPMWHSQSRCSGSCSTNSHQVVKL